MIAFRLNKKVPISKLIAGQLGGSWKAIRCGFGWYWKCDDGREVHAYSQLAPQHDGDDETAFTVYIDNDGKRIII